MGDWHRDYEFHTCRGAFAGCNKCLMRMVVVRVDRAPMTVPEVVMSIGRDERRIREVIESAIERGDLKLNAKMQVEVCDV